MTSSLYPVSRLTFGDYAAALRLGRQLHPAEVTGADISCGPHKTICLCPRGQMELALMPLSMHRHIETLRAVPHPRNKPFSSLHNVSHTQLPAPYEYDDADDPVLVEVPATELIQETGATHPRLYNVLVACPHAPDVRDPLDRAGCSYWAGMDEPRAYRGTISEMIAHLYDLHRWPGEQIALWLESLDEEERA
ncbi:MAG: hypothetical protein NVSMB65_14590 [Chloroflexota bacterium]